MQNGSEQVCNDETEEVSELVGDEVGVGEILPCEDALDLVFCDDTETLIADVGGMLELVEVGTGFDVIRLPCEDMVDLVFCVDTETLMQDKSEQDCEADVAEMLELVADGTGLEALEIPCAPGGVPLD